MGEAQLGHQASAEYKLKFCLGLRDVYFAAVYSAEKKRLNSNDKIKIHGANGRVVVARYFVGLVKAEYG